VPYFNWFARKSVDFPEIKFSFLCMYPERPKMIEDMKGYSCDVYWIKYDEKKRKAHLIKALFETYSIINKLQPDVVHSHLFDDALVSMLSSKLVGVPIRAITKGDACYHYFYAPKWMIFDKINNFFATHIVALSGENKKFILDKEKANINKVKIIHHGIPQEDYLNVNKLKVSEFREKYKIKGKTVFTSIGRLEKNKGFLEVIDVLSELKKNTEDFIFVIAGEGVLKEALNDKIIKYNLQEHVYLLGWVDEEDIPALYEISDVYVHNSHFETFGFVIAEAMMHGLPIIATNTSGAAKDVIKHKENGYLFDYKDNEDLSKGIRFYMHDENRLNKSENKKIAIEKFEFNNMWDKHIELYRDALAK
jgi:glycosyltransferase involved in cell wall biosynthesis